MAVVSSSIANECCRDFWMIPLKRRRKEEPSFASKPNPSFKMFQFIRDVIPAMTSRNKKIFNIKDGEVTRRRCTIARHGHRYNCFSTAAENAIATATKSRVVITGSNSRWNRLSKLKPTRSRYI